MDTLSYLLLILLMVLSPLAHVICGEWVCDGAYCRLRRVPTSPPITEYLCAYYLVGLFVSLTMMLLLCCVGIPLRVCALLLLLPLAIRFSRIALWRERVSFAPTFAFCGWFGVVLLLGVSLVSTVDGIQTPWRNNYGDLAWHLGMIDSFVFGRNFPPQNHLFAGETLSYPFFINLWTAALWSLISTPTAFAQILLYQWMAIWVIVYYSLNGDRSRFLPWAALFGGGAYTVASESIRLLDTGVVRYAHELIDKGYPWTPFLSTIWVTQRPATLGAAALLAAVCLVHSFVYGPEREGAERKSLYAGLLLATAPLVHTHLFLVGALYLLSLLGIQTVRASLPRKSLFCLILGLFPSILYLPWLIGKSGIIRVAGGWMQNEQTGFVTAFGGGMSLWWQNALPWLVLAAVGTALTKRYAAGAVLVMSFIFGNIFQIAIWNWDEIKIFLGIYLISIALWDAPSARFMRHAQWLLLFLMLPSLTELYVSLGKYERYTIYTADEVNLAARIRQATEPTAVIAAAPDHNSPVTLTGRKMFYGYEGTLSSHGIDFGNRQQMFQELDRLLGCRPDDINPCPDFLLWTERERRYWKRAEPGDNAEPTAVPELFRLLRGQSTGAAS